jgi:hypothetical protein
MNVHRASLIALQMRTVSTYPNRTSANAEMTLSMRAQIGIDLVGCAGQLWSMSVVLASMIVTKTLYAKIFHKDSHVSVGRSSWTNRQIGLLIQEDGVFQDRLHHHRSAGLTIVDHVRLSSMKFAGKFKSWI